VGAQSRPIKRILLLDNSSADTNSAVESLEGAGYEIITSGAEASVVDLVPEAKPDCLLVSINTADEPGPIIELVTSLRVIEGLKGAPFVVFTPSELSEQFKHRLMASGVRIVVCGRETLCKTIFSEVKNLQHI
jgi:CheY-like chemotaxis protein